MQSLHAVCQDWVTRLRQPYIRLASKPDIWHYHDVPWGAVVAKQGGFATAEPGEKSKRRTTGRGIVEVTRIYQQS